MIHLGGLLLGLVPRLDVKPQSLENNRPPQLNAQKNNSIEEAILSADVSGGNATASQWLERGNQLWRLGRNKEAVKAFDEAINQKPSFVHLAFYGKSLALMRQFKLKEAIAALNQAVKFKPNFVAAWQSLSSINVLDTILNSSNNYIGKFNKALIAINKAIKLQPQNPNLYYAKSLVLSYLEQYTKAEIAINQAIKLNPRAAFYLNRADFYKGQEKWDLALADYNEAIQINPEYADAYHNRAKFYKEQKKWDLALADYSKLIELEPERTRYYSSRARLYEKQEKWDLALADYNKAIQVNPEDAHAYYKRADFYKGQEKWDLALADYNKAIQVNPEDATAYFSRAAFYIDRGNKQKAIQDLQKAAQLFKAQDNQFFYNMAIEALKNFTQQHKKRDVALTEYNQAIELNPNSEVYKMMMNHLQQIQK